MIIVHLFCDIMKSDFRISKPNNKYRNNIIITRLITLYLTYDS